MSQLPPTPNDAAPIHETVIQWHEVKDDYGVAYWIADSPLHDGNGMHFKYRIVRRIGRNRIVYGCDSDHECCGTCGDWWPTLTEAKAAFEEMNRTILRELANV